VLRAGGGDEPKQDISLLADKYLNKVDVELAGSGVKEEGAESGKDGLHGWSKKG